MRVLVATRESQGARSDDFDWCIEGELVWIQEPCDRDRRRDPLSCRCGRAFAGMASHSATTTAVVREMPGLTRAEYEGAFRTSLIRQGWPADWAEGLIDELLLHADSWAEGTVIERYLDLIGCRYEPDTGELRPPPSTIRM